LNAALNGKEKTMTKNGPTAVLIVLDAVGKTTLEYLLKKSGRTVNLPNLARMGLGNILSAGGGKAVPPDPEAQFAAAITQASAYPDSTIGHREMVGVIDPRKYELFPNGFPEDFVHALEREIGMEVIFNKMAGGMEAIEENRELHEKTGKPILYSSKCDPVLQIAMNENVIPVAEQHRIVDVSFALARRMGINITRSIGRPYVMKNGAIFRTPNRHDCTLPLDRPTLIDVARKRGIRTVSVGKTAELVGARFDDLIKLTDPSTLDPALHYNFVDGARRDTNPFCIQGIVNALAAARDLLRPQGTFVFANLVDTDSLFGHTRDIDGALRALEEFDRHLPQIKDLLSPGDLLMITADHGMEHRADYGYHSLEPAPLLAARLDAPFDLSRFAKDTLAQAGYFVAQLFGCAEEFTAVCRLGPYLAKQPKG